ncbi:Imm49 family immunity protein [Streptomyces gelaticus]
MRRPGRTARVREAKKPGAPCPRGNRVQGARPVRQALVTSLFPGPCRNPGELGSPCGPLEGRTQNIEGVVAIAPLAVACLAKASGIRVEVESGYLPNALLNFAWRGEFDA